MWRLSIPATVSVTGKQAKRWFDSRKQALAEVDRLKKHQQQVGSSAKLLDAGRIIEAADAWNLLDKAFQAQPAPPGTLRRIVQQEIKVMHDLGKYSEGFQARLDDNSIRGINHWAAGARKAFELKAPLVAYAIDGHHTGLPEAGHLLESMTKMADAVLAPAHFTTQFEFQLV